MSYSQTLHSLPTSGRPVGTGTIASAQIPNKRQFSVRSWTNIYVYILNFANQF
jgi:hypothetical protein